MKAILRNLMILALFFASAYGQAIPAAKNEKKATVVAPPPVEDLVSEASVPAVQTPEDHFPVLRALGGLGLVVCLMVAVYFAARKFAPRFFNSASSDKNLRVIETLSMGDRRSISLIEVASNRFLVGNTPHQINLLAALPDPVSLLSEPNTLAIKQKDATHQESRVPFRKLFEVEKKRSPQYMGNPLPDDLRTKMRQLREALER